MFRKVRIFFPFVCLCGLVCGQRSATISNKEPRKSTDGNVLNAHSGTIVYVNGTYFMYGEYYGRGPYIVTGNELFPKLSVYTSTDMVTWNYGGLLHNNSKGVEGAPPVWSESPHWKYHPKGTWWSPSAVYDKRSDSIIIWFSASPGECCSAYFGIAKSRNGVNFELVSLSETPATNVSVDGSSVLIDDDGEGYVAYTAMGVPGQDAHVVAIDKLTDDYLGTAKTQVGNFFPDPFVEGVMLFKRKGVYYLLYGSCCCACREGSGAVVHMAKDIAGPWTRQPGGESGW